MATTALPSAANTSSLLVFKGAIGFTKASERAALLAGITQAKLVEYKSWFRRLDTMNHGYIEMEELEYRLSNENLVRASNEIGMIAAEMDTDGNGILDFEEFAIMMCFLEKLAKEQNDKTGLFATGDTGPSLWSFPPQSGEFWRRLRAVVWRTVEDPNSSRIASALSVIIISFILLSTVALVVETMPSVQADDEFAIIEALTAVVFSMEFLARLLSTQHLGQFIRTPMNWIDFASILPWYFDMMFELNETRVLRVLRVLRVVRVFKLSRYFTSLSLLTSAFVNSGSAMGMAFFLTMLGVLLLGSIMFYIERGSLNEETNMLEIAPGQPSQFYSIMQSCWWCIVTIASVGYGDVTPVTELGQLFGGLVSVFGVILLAFPVSIFSANFAEVYTSAKRKAALHHELQQNFVPVVQGRTGTSLLQPLLAHLPRISLAERQSQFTRIRTLRRSNTLVDSFQSTNGPSAAVALEVDSFATLKRIQTAPGGSMQQDSDDAIATPARRRSMPSKRAAISSTPTRTSFFTPPPTSPVCATPTQAGHGQRAAPASLSRSLSTGLLLSSPAPQPQSRKNSIRRQLASTGERDEQLWPSGSDARNTLAERPLSPESAAHSTGRASISPIRRTKSWDENRNPSNHYANSSTSTHTVNLLASSQIGAMACVPVPLHNTNRGTGRNRLRTLRRSMSDSDIDTPVQPFGGVLSNVDEINPFGKGSPHAMGGHIESDEMILTADSFLGLNLADASVLKQVTAALLRDSRKRLWQRIRRVELRLRDELVTELSRRWRVWFGVHAAAVVVAATPYTIDRVKMAFQVRRCRVMPDVMKVPNSAGAYAPHVRFPASVKSVMGKAKEHASLTTPERYTSFRSPARDAGCAAGYEEREAAHATEQRALLASIQAGARTDADSKLVPNNTSVQDSADSSSFVVSGAAVPLPLSAKKTPARKPQSERDDDPVSWQKDAPSDIASPLPPVALALADRKAGALQVVEPGLRGSDTSSEGTTNSDIDSDGSHDVVYTKKVRTVKRLTSTGEQVTETETRIVKKRLRRAKRSGHSNRSLLSASD